MLYLIVIVAIILLLVIMSYLIKKNKINFKFVYLNFIVLLCFIAVVLILMIPQVKPFLMQYVGFIPRDFLLAVAVGYLFYANFIQGIIIAKQNEKIDKIASIISVEQSLNNYKEQDEKDRNTD